MTSTDWQRRDGLFSEWERADARLLKAVLRFPLDDGTIERIYQDERQAMTRLAEFDRAMGLRPGAGKGLAPRETQQAVA